VQIGPLRRAHHYAIVDVFVLGGNGRIQLTGISNLDRPRVDRDRQLPVLNLTDKNEFAYDGNAIITRGRTFVFKHTEKATAGFNRLFQ